MSIGGSMDRWCCCGGCGMKSGLVVALVAIDGTDLWWGCDGYQMKQQLSEGVYLQDIVNVKMGRERE